jgi:hypothetical protein
MTVFYLTTRRLPGPSYTTSVDAAVQLQPKLRSSRERRRTETPKPRGDPPGTAKADRLGMEPRAQARDSRDRWLAWPGSEWGEGLVFPAVSLGFCYWFDWLLLR